MPNSKEDHAKCCDDHQEAAEKYAATVTSAHTMFQILVDSYEDGKKALIESGAFRVDEEGKIQPGWYESDAGYEKQDVDPQDNSRVVAGGSAVGVVGAIGAPAAAWTLVGTFGTASTGAAISGLSGAAATSATAAWFGGGSIAAGGLGMVAAPFVLTGIGAVAGLSILGVAALIARNRNSRNEKDMADANATMREARWRMSVNASRLQALEWSAKQRFTNLIKTTGVLETNKSFEAADAVRQALIEAEELFAELQKPLPYVRLYIGRPSPVETITNVTTTKTYIYVSWDDPDEGNSEIIGYKILYSEGFWGGETYLMTSPTTAFTHNGLEPGTTYRYKIIPVNKIGEAKQAKQVEAKTRG